MTNEIWKQREINKCNNLLSDTTLRDVERHHIVNYLNSLKNIKFIKE